MDVQATDDPLDGAAVVGAASPRRRSRWIVLSGAALVAALVGTAIVVVSRRDHASRATPQDVTILGVPTSNGFDMVAVGPEMPPEDGVALASSAEPLGVPELARAYGAPTLGSRLAPLDDGWLGYSVVTGGKTELVAFDLADRKSEVLYEGSADARYAFDSSSGVILASDVEGDRQRCVRLRRDGEPEIFDEGAWCVVEVGGSVVEVGESSARSERQRVSVHPVNGKTVEYETGAVVLVDGQSGLLVSAEYVDDASEHQRISVLRSASGDPIFESDEVLEGYVVATGPGDQLILGFDRDDGGPGATLLRNGEATPIPDHDLVAAAISPTGTVVYATNDGTTTLLKRWVPGTDPTTLATAQDAAISFTLVGEPDAALYAWDEDGVVYSGRADSGALEKLGQMYDPLIETVYTHAASQSIVFVGSDGGSFDTWRTVYGAMPGSELSVFFGGLELDVMDATDDGDFVMSRFEAGDSTTRIVAFRPDGAAHVEVGRYQHPIASGRWNSVAERYRFTVYEGAPPSIESTRDAPKVYESAVDGEEPVAIWDGWSILDGSNDYRHISVVGSEPDTIDDEPLFEGLVLDEEDVACVADAAGTDVEGLDELGITSGDPGLSQATDWLLATGFPPDAERVNVIAALFSCVDLRGLVLSRFLMNDSDESQCFAQLIADDPEIRVWVPYGDFASLLDVGLPADELDARVQGYLGECGAVL